MREQHVLDARPVSGEHLVTDAAHGEHMTTQGHFACNGRVAPHRGVQQHRCQRQQDGDACRRAIFRNTASREVHVDVLPPEGVPICVDALSHFLVRRGPARVERRQHLGVRRRGWKVGATHASHEATPEQGHCCVHALGHDRAQLSGDSELATALHPRRLDEEQLATDARHREAHGDAWDKALGQVGLVELWAEDVLQVMRVHGDDASGIRAACLHNSLGLGVLAAAAQGELLHADALKPQRRPTADLRQQTL
mmetsp:Transcript_18373/g.53056  ORF Transcript_18373/g.53056 Transcript_18373/m.53056 type:complete len:253 (+) Transcript_18373:820-1578(+)